MCFTVCLAALMYAITGGPSSGKTSIIKELEKKGESVVHEAATDWILSKIKAGVPEPWKEKNCILDIFKLHLERERPYLSLMAESLSTEVFLMGTLLRWVTDLLEPRH